MLFRKSGIVMLDAVGMAGSSLPSTMLEPVCAATLHMKPAFNMLQVLMHCPPPDLLALRLQRAALRREAGI